MLDLGAVKHRERWEKHVWAIRLRATTLLGVTFVYAYLALTDRVPVNPLAIGLIMGLFAFNAHRRKRASRSFSRWMIGLDIVLITVAVWATGGVATYLLPLYFVQVVATSLHTNPRQGVISAFTAWALFAGMALLEAGGVLPHGPLAGTPSAALLATDLGFVEAQILGLFVLLGAVTYSSGFIAQRLRVRELEVSRAHHELEILYDASQGFLSAESVPDLCHGLCVAAELLGAAACAVFLQQEEGARCLASRPRSLDAEAMESLSLRAEAWLSETERPRALSTLRSEKDYGLIQFHLGSGARGVVVVRAAIENLLRGHTEGLQLLVQQFSAALTNLEALEAHVHLATTDALTGAANRREFDETLRDELARAGRYGRPASLILIDLDNFKRLNDTRGHPEGDRVLREAVQCLRHALRSMDTLARYGGEEFAVVAPETGPGQAVILGERLRRAVAEHDFFPDEPEARVSASLGVASRIPQRREVPPAELIRRADLALYAAKEGGRNRVEAYRADLDPQAEAPAADAS